MPYTWTYDGDQLVKAVPLHERARIATNLLELDKLRRDLVQYNISGQNGPLDNHSRVRLKPCRLSFPGVRPFLPLESDSQCQLRKRKAASVIQPVKSVVAQLESRKDWANQQCVCLCASSSLSSWADAHMTT